MVPWGVPKTTWGTNRFQNISPWYFLSSFSRHLGDAGCHLGGNWVPRGSQNSTFGYQDAIKWQKKLDERGCQKNCSFLLRLQLKEIESLGVQTLPNALYISISVVFASYDQIINLMKQLCENETQNHGKNDNKPDDGPKNYQKSIPERKFRSENGNRTSEGGNRVSEGRTWGPGHGGPQTRVPCAKSPAGLPAKPGGALFKYIDR